MSLVIPKYFYFSYANLKPQASVKADYDENRRVKIRRNEVSFIGSFEIRWDEVSFIGSGSKWTDVFATPRFVFVSEKAAAGIREAGLTGIELIDLPIGDIESKKLRETRPEKVFLMDVTGKVPVDMAILEESRNERNMFDRFVPSDPCSSTPDFFWADGVNYNVIFCSRRVIEIARRDGWTNLKTASMDYLLRPFDMGEFHIDYLGKQWPPQWYPDGYEPHPNNLEEVDALPDPRESGPKISAPKPKKQRPKQLKPQNGFGGLTFVKGNFASWVADIPRELATFFGEPIYLEVSGVDVSVDSKKNTLAFPEVEAELGSLIVENLKTLMPLIERELRDYHSTADDLKTMLCNPHISINRELVVDIDIDPMGWSFCVEEEDGNLATYVEFIGLEFQEVWAGD